MSSMRRKRPAVLIACSSRRHQRSAVGTAAVTRDTSSWASLHEDLVSLIGYRVLAGDLQDYIRFRAVCPHWRDSTACPRGRGVVDPRFHPRRWMLLPEGHGLHPGHGKMRGYIRFFNLSAGAFVRVKLPIFKDHCVLDSIDGILLLHRDKDTAIRLLHPFTGDIVELPPLDSLVPYVVQFIQGGNWQYLRNIRAASISVGADGVVKVMMSLPGMRYIAFASSGDQQWKVSRWWVEDGSHPLSFQGKLYMLKRSTVYGEPEVLQIDPYQQEGMDTCGSTLPPPKLIAKCPMTTKGHAAVYHMVECNSEVLVVMLRVGGHRRCSVYRLADLILGRTVPVTSIGGNALFLGKRTICVNSKAFPTIAGDTIVFYHHVEHYLAQYHLSTGTLSPTSDGCITVGNLPSPTSIIYHLYTCCFREFWNKGHVIYQGKPKCWRVKRKWRAGT